MKQAVSGSMPVAIIGALALTSSCAEILGLEPAVVGGSGGSGASTATGGSAGTGGAGGCTVDAQCPAAGLPPCQKPVCVEGKCQSVPAEDGEEIPCYTGDPATEGMGICKAGVLTCTDGIPGQCNGEVLPAEKEDCDTPEDDDCDGA